MRTEHLPSHHVPHAQLSLRHVANVTSLWIHDNILVRLLKSKHYIHKLQLSRHHYGGIRKYACRRVPLVEHAIWIFGDENRGEEVVRIGILISQCT